MLNGRQAIHSNLNYAPSQIQKEKKKFNTYSNLAIAQGVFFVASGLWPILSMRTFEKVTGPKKEDWLVKTVGLLISISGSTLLRSGLRSEVPNDIKILAQGQAFALGSISLFYSLVGRISKIYLLDTLVEYSWTALWAFSRPDSSHR